MVNQMAKTNSREMEKGQKALERGRGWDPLLNYVFIANINFALLAKRFSSYYFLGYF